MQRSNGVGEPRDLLNSHDESQHAHTPDVCRRTYHIPLHHLWSWREGRVGGEDGERAGEEREEREGGRKDGRKIRREGGWEEGSIGGGRGREKRREGRR